MKRVFVVGGSGYVGSQLVARLLEESYYVTVYDLMIYGNNLPKNKPNLKTIVGDIRNIKKLNEALKDQDIVIHLACVSNDPSFELNPILAKDINFSCFEPLIQACKNLGIKKFIYASSSSVYGIKEEKEVNEDSLLKPLSDYSIYKSKCEDILLNYTDNNFIGTVLRPATVCGYSPRQRLDLVVNILVNYAYHLKKIEVFGGNQLRPNIHIQDMVDAYLCVMVSDINKIKDQIFNVGFENYAVKDLALMVKKNVGNEVKIIFKETKDDRSYHISSKKISKLLGFIPKRSIDEAVKDLIYSFREKILINTFDDDNFYNIKKMQKVKLV
jgi:nucleoside-diphosphate-sugar epimerase